MKQRLSLYSQKNNRKRCLAPVGRASTLAWLCCACHLLASVSCETSDHWSSKSQFNKSLGYQRTPSDPPYKQSYNTYNEVDADAQFEDSIHDEVRSPLLVGYSHDPYGNSMKSTDFHREPHKHKPAPSSKDRRDKRGVLHLYNMISCATGCDPISYKGYGCYCGFLGSGVPLDGIDGCCRTHDKCYEHLFCPFYTVYFQPYYWKCYHKEPLCALENYNTRNKFINGCASRLCECDRQLAMCLRRYRCPSRPAICRSSPLRLLQNLLMYSW